ncbi:helix-turn-helix domain-containing protein [Neisseria animalis]|uniref:XRE family transcriptional regulator n=1 Tax=Neisseria animalis TaxID=492 RepID=A0A5P3MTS0_NEIAN|nr:XRE family transcriptional regulator [Neisseria animalis]QEY25016.1 XRE family transcriptional regulator [Neisseria animalis]ROW32360.1 XRE family transcriptional regulator [Neisseria animalis]VEE06583.1 HTH-type transcriptional regulator PuuR [Neisseria animalis]
MPFTQPHTLPADSGSFLSLKLHRLRKQSGQTLQQLSEKSGISVSALSKIEKGQLSPTYEKIAALARGLDIHVAELFYEEQHSAPNGRLAVTRAGEAPLHRTAQYDYRPLCGELTNKQFVPLLTTVKARSIKEFPAKLQHEGEEFVYVLEGEITIHTDFYQPVTLYAGDCCYFDSGMGHACVAGGSDALILWICSHPTVNKDG